MKEKIAFFDFCETLVDFQTADAFVCYVVNNHNSIHVRIRVAIVSFLHRFRIISILERLIKVPLNKKFVLWQIRGLSEDVVSRYARSFYEERLKPHQISVLVNIMHQLQQKGWRIILVSGGYDVYLRVFAKNNGINEEDIVSSEIEFRRGKCTGRMRGPDCMGTEKVVRMDSMFEKESIESRAYSDSKGDLPMLLWVDEAFVVSKNKAPQWAIDNGFKSVLWEKSLI